MYIDFIIISYLINYGLVYSALYIKRSKLNLLSHAEVFKDISQHFVGGYLSASDLGESI
jgi:hypothetical protein